MSILADVRYVAQAYVAFADKGSSRTSKRYLIYNEMFSFRRCTRGWQSGIVVQISIVDRTTISLNYHQLSEQNLFPVIHHLLESLVMVQFVSRLATHWDANK